MVILNGEYREYEQRTYIVKEHYDWLKSSASLSTLQKLPLYSVKLSIHGFMN